MLALCEARFSNTSPWFSGLRLLNTFVVFIPCIPLMRNASRISLFSVLAYSKRLAISFALFAKYFCTALATSASPLANLFCKLCTSANLLSTCGSDLLFLNKRLFVSHNTSISLANCSAPCFHKASLSLAILTKSSCSLLRLSKYALLSLLLASI